jgi:hypothetical protein
LTASAGIDNVNKFRPHLAEQSFPETGSDDLLGIKNTVEGLEVEEPSPDSLHRRYSRARKRNKSSAAQYTVKDVVLHEPEVDEEVVLLHYTASSRTSTQLGSGFRRHGKPARNARLILPLWLLS